MARAKTSRSKSTSSSSSTAASKARSSKSAPKSRSSSQQDDESLSSASFSRARDFVETNANLQTAGIALAGAGILALVSTQAGRNLIKTATDTVVGLVSQKIADFTNESVGQSGDANTNQRPSRQRDQERV